MSSMEEINEATVAFKTGHMTVQFGSELCEAVLWRGVRFGLINHRTLDGLLMRILDHVLGWVMEQQLVPLVEGLTGGDRDGVGFSVEVCELEDASGEWDKAERMVWIDRDLLADPEELWSTLLHEAVHVVHPEYSEDQTESTAEGIAEQLTELEELRAEDEEPSRCADCKRGWHDLCVATNGNDCACECSVCEDNP